MRMAAFAVSSAHLKERTMKNRIAHVEERQFITKEFADALAGKQPHPYLRLHDSVLQAFIDTARGPYADRMIHFWREISLAGIDIGGRGMDECYALVFESVFDLAQAEPEWAAATFAGTDSSNHRFNALKQLNHQLCRPPLTHASLVGAYRRCYAPLREEDRRWQNAAYVATAGEAWFWAAITCVAGIDENHPGWEFRCDLAAASLNGWRDDGWLNLRLIREAPRRAEITPRAELMAHPLLRLARLKYPEGSIEQAVALRFFNARSIAQGFESEEDYFGGDLTLAEWVRDARSWAEQLMRNEPPAYAAMLDEFGKNNVELNLAFYREELGARPEQFDDLDTTFALMRWGKRKRDNKCLSYRAEVLEFVADVVDAALWLGWLFPRKSNATSTKRLRPGASRTSS